MKPKLTEGKVIAIRDSRLTHAELASIYNVSKRQISRIQRGVQWAAVRPESPEYRRGYDGGYRDGHVTGYERGWRHALDSVQRITTPAVLHSAAPKPCGPSGGDIGRSLNASAVSALAADPLNPRANLPPASSDRAGVLR